MEGFVPLAVEAGASATYTLKLVENTLPVTTYVTLEDLKTGISQRLDNKPEYSFTSAPGEEPNRFRLHFKDATSVPGPSLSGVTIYSADGTIVVLGSAAGSKISVSDLAGRILATRNSENAKTILNMNGHTGVYLVSIMDSTGIYTQKVLVK